MKTVGFVGIGIMGSRMCRNLLKAGFPLVVCDVDPKAVQALEKEGATSAPTPAEVAKQVEVLLLSLPNSPEVLEVALGPDGIVQGAHEGLVVGDLSTVAPSTPQRISAELKPHGIDWLDTPVSGGPGGAEAATLTIMVGGDKDAVERSRPVFEALGRIEYMGGSGLGATTKIVNQLACGVEMLAMFEAFTVGVAAGIDGQRLWEVLHVSTSRCWIMEELIPAVVLKNKFETPRFALRLMHKDIRIALDTAKSLNVPAAAIALSEQMYSVAESVGWGELDHMAPINLYGKAAGIERW